VALSEQVKVELHKAVACHKKKKKKKKTTLVSACFQVRPLKIITGLQKVFKVFYDVSKAL
jgi:hypothetical protein